MALCRRAVDRAVRVLASGLRLLLAQAPEGVVEPASQAGEFALQLSDTDLLEQEERAQERDVARVLSGTRGTPGADGWRPGRGP